MEHTVSGLDSYQDLGAEDLRSQASTEGSDHANDREPDELWRILSNQSCAPPGICRTPNMQCRGGCTRTVAGASPTSDGDGGAMGENWRGDDSGCSKTASS